MKAIELIESIKLVFQEIQTDGQVAKLLGITAGRISQWRSTNKDVTPRQVASAFMRVAEASRIDALRNAIRPIVEFYPVERTASRGDAGWEIVPSVKSNPRQAALKKYLIECKGVYFFYNSEGEVIYSGKTEKQTLWREMNLSFNRERTSHTAFLVDHPTTGNTFQPGWERLRQPKKRKIVLCDVAAYFSAYSVAPQLIASLEALVVRSICNDLSNVRMERFKFDG